MGLVNLVIVAVMGIAVGLSTRYFSPGELQDRFENGQKFYALGDYSAAIDAYRKILETKSNILINIDEAMVNVDEFLLPIRVASTYQLGNSHKKLGLDKLQRSKYLKSEGNLTEADERYHEARSDLNRGIEYFSRIVSNTTIEERTRVMAQYQIIETSYELEDYKDVIESGRKLLDQFPNSLYESTVYYDIGWAYLNLGEYEKAIDNLKQVLVLSPSGQRSDRAMFQIGEAYSRLQQYDEALTYFQRLVNRYDFSKLSEKELAEMVSLKLKGVVQETPRELVAKAQLYTSQEKYDEAKNKLDAAIDRVTDRKTLGQLHFIKGRILFTREQYSDAITELSGAIEMNDDPEVLESAIFTRGTSHYRLAKQLDTQSDTRSATEHYEASLKDLQTLLSRTISPKIKDTAYRILGASMIRLGRQQEAVNYYEQIIKSTEDPQERANFQFLLTELYNDMGNLEKVAESGRTLIAMEFRDSNMEGFYRKERAYALIGNSSFQQKQYDEAIATFTEGLKRYPNSSESSYMLFSKAFAELSKGDYEASARDFDLHVKTYPKDQNAIHARYYLAHSYQALGQLDRAAPVFYELVQRYPKSDYEAEALFLAAENFYDSRMFDRTEETYKKFLSGYPNDQRAAAAQYGLAWSYYERNSMENMVTAMSTLVANYPQSEYAPKAQFTIGDYYYNIKDYPHALAAYTVVADRYPSSSEAGKARGLIGELSEIQASLEYDEVMKKFDNKDYEDAIKGFTQVIDKYPNSYTAIASLCNIGMAYENMDQWKKAKEIYDQIVEKAGNDPSSADAVDFAKEHRRWIVEKRL